ncbi:MAG: Bug family tripartite tricarboxylate transporter substrate binding protein [Burkholderiaceae bacterium]
MTSNSFTRRQWLATAVGSVALSVPWPALAQTEAWPSKPIRLIVPYPPGGLTDIVSRALSDELGKQLGVPVVVENKAGAGGQVGLDQMLQAPRDGYTIGLVVPATMITLPLTNPNFKIKPLEQLEPITAAIDTFLTLVVDSKLGVNSLQEFVDLARRNPGKFNYGTPGVGTSFHFNNVAMAAKLGIETVHVPYQGEVKILTDIAGGALQYALVSNAGKPFIDSGQVRALAVSSARRTTLLPSVPTFKEQGIDFQSDGWVGYAVAKGTPKPIVERISAAFTRTLQNPAVNKRLTDMGHIVTASSPEQFVKEIQEGTRTYGELVRSGRIKLD